MQFTKLQTNTQSTRDGECEEAKDGGEKKTLHFWFIFTRCVLLFGSECCRSASSEFLSSSDDWMSSCVCALGPKCVCVNLSMFTCNWDRARRKDRERKSGRRTQSSKKLGEKFIFFFHPLFACIIDNDSCFWVKRILRLVIDDFHSVVFSSCVAPPCVHIHAHVSCGVVHRLT